MKIDAAQRQLVSLALAVAFAAAVLLPSAGQGETPAAAPGLGTGTETPVVVFAAASLKTALDAIAAAWKINTGKTASIAYASSGTLAKQIEQGAPADIFISADLNWMDTLEKAKLIRAETRRRLLGNKLVLIEPSDADTKLEIVKGFDLAADTGDGKIAVCALDLGTGGIYAKEALELAWDLRECRTKARAGRYDPQCPEPRFTRRGQIRHCLCHRRQGRPQGEGRGHFSSVEP